jgi:hypothetical protein
VLRYIRRIEVNDGTVKSHRIESEAPPSVSVGTTDQHDSQLFGTFT